MNLPPFPSIPQSPEERLRLTQYGELVRAMYEDDAERYRWLRDSARVDIGCGTVGYLCFGAAIHGERWDRMYDDNSKPTGSDVDAAIDAARSGGKGGGE